MKRMAWKNYQEALKKIPRIVSNADRLRKMEEIWIAGNPKRRTRKGGNRIDWNTTHIDFILAPEDDLCEGAYLFLEELIDAGLLPELSLDKIILKPDGKMAGFYTDRTYQFRIDFDPEHSEKCRIVKKSSYRPGYSVDEHTIIC